MSALSRFMRDNSPAVAIQNRVEWRRWLVHRPIRNVHISQVYTRDMRFVPYREDGTLDYARSYESVSWRGRGG